MVTRPSLLVFDEPIEGIQPSFIKEFGRAIDYLRSKGDMAIFLVEQYFEFAQVRGLIGYRRKRFSLTARAFRAFLMRMLRLTQHSSLSKAMSLGAKRWGKRCKVNFVQISGGSSAAVPWS